MKANKNPTYFRQTFLSIFLHQMLFLALDKYQFHRYLSVNKTINEVCTTLYKTQTHMEENLKLNKTIVTAIFTIMSFNEFLSFQ